MTADTPRRPSTDRALHAHDSSSRAPGKPASSKPGKLRRRIRSSIHPSASAGRKVKVGAGTVVVHGLPLHSWRDAYHTALTLSWPAFFGTLAVLFLLLNTAFAGLYMLGDAPIANQFPHGFPGAFFFSAETLATVGYGDMHPQTAYAHLVALLEIFVGMSGIALATGLVFARFSRPRAKILFAHQAVIYPHDGRMMLMVRAANARQNVLAEAHAKLRLIRTEILPTGYRQRHLYDLRLVHDQYPIFLLDWDLMHVIDKNSPLYGETAASLAQSHTMLMLVIEGSDESTAQTMQARHFWSARDILWQYRYVDLRREENGVSHIDYSHFHEIAPYEAPAEAQPPGTKESAGTKQERK
jgi:inward rectifier potassium channel